jgi:hypothetical protein
MKAGDKRASRKATLRRLAAKHGWQDGYEGMEANPVTKVVMTAYGRPGHHGVPRDEENAYWQGYGEGCEARRRGDTMSVNPYGL